MDIGPTTRLQWWWCDWRNSWRGRECLRRGYIFGDHPPLRESNHNRVRKQLLLTLVSISDDRACARGETKKLAEKKRSRFALLHEPPFNRLRSSEVFSMLFIIYLSIRQTATIQKRKREGKERKGTSTQLLIAYSTDDDDDEKLWMNKYLIYTPETIWLRPKSRLDCCKKLRNQSLGRDTTRWRIHLMMMTGFRDIVANKKQQQIDEKELYSKLYHSTTRGRRRRLIHSTACCRLCNATPMRKLTTSRVDDNHTWSSLLISSKQPYDRVESIALHVTILSPTKVALQIITEVNEEEEHEYFDEDEANFEDQCEGEQHENVRSLASVVR